MSTILEFTTFQASAEYQKDLEGALLKPMHDALLKVDGVISAGVYNGLHVEDRSLGEAIVLWSSYEAQQAFRAGPYADLESLFQPAVNLNPTSAPVARISASFDDPQEALSVILSAPFTEIAEVSTEKAEEFAEALELLTQLKESVPASAGCLGIAVGLSQGKENSTLVIAGWPSIEAHSGAVHAEKPKEISEAMMAIPGIKATMFHVTLRA